jgi:tetratricopeptide (TPR) repeat protein
VLRALAGIDRRQGRWKESGALFDQALERDPQNVLFLADAALNGLETRNPAWAQKILRRALDLSPQNSTVVAELASSYQLSGDIKQAQTILEGARAKEGDFFYINIFVYNAILLRNYEPAIVLLKGQLEKVRSSDSTFVSYEAWLGDLQRHAGDTTAAAESYRKAKVTAEQLLRDEANNADILDNLAWTETWLGDKSLALQHAQRAVALMPRSKEPRTGPGCEDTLARIQAHFGYEESAIAALQNLLATPYSYPNVTPALLRIDPDWDNLRGDPRFEKLCHESTK